MRWLNEELHIACREDDLASVKRLLEEGADINAQIYSGGTALHYCASYGCFDICKLLLEKGADATAKNNHGHTPYDIAEQFIPTSRNCLKIANLLKSHIKNNIAKKVKDKLNDIEI